MANKHVHKFRRHRYKTGNAVYYCALPDCNVKILPALTLGKMSLCWRCGNVFQMNEYSIRLAKPHCDDCHKPKDQSELVIPDSNAAVVPVSQPSAITNLRSRLMMATSPAIIPKESDEDEDDGEI